MGIIFIPSSQDLEEQQQWIEKEVAAVGQEKIDELVKKALEQRKFSYAPYSGYNVGVAVLTHDGGIFTGANAERVSYSETDHAEQAAITTAVNAGAAIQNRKFIRMVAVAHTDPSAPCGHCRQIIMEHCDNCVVIVADSEGTIRYSTSMKILLPKEFTPSALGK